MKLFFNAKITLNPNEITSELPRTINSREPAARWI